MKSAYVNLFTVLGHGRPITLTSFTKHFPPDEVSVRASEKAKNGFSLSTVNRIYKTNFDHLSNEKRVRKLAHCSRARQADNIDFIYNTAIYHYFKIDLWRVTSCVVL